MAKRCAVSVGFLLVVVLFGRADAQCVGDCSGDGEVTINEIITCVNIGLGLRPPGDCSSCDANDDGAVAINEIIRSVNVGLGLIACDGETGTPTSVPRATPTGAPSPTSTPTATPTEPAGTETGSLGGQVVDVSTREAISGATVALDTGGSATTDANGFYSFEDVPAGAIIASFSKDGYANSTKRVDVAEGDARILCVMLKEEGAPQMLDTARDEMLVEGDSSVTIRARSLQRNDGSPVTGEVELVVTKIDPSTDDVMSFPGSFEMAMNTDGNMVQLESFGFATYELTQDGEEVDLAPGETARIEFVLPANAQDQFDVGDTIPLWELDEETAMWMEVSPPGDIVLASDGSGLKAWVAEVDHFSSWNCDAPIEDRNCVTGTVESDGAPVAGAQVTAVGLTYNGTSNARSDANGRFCIDVKRGSTASIEVRLNGSAVPVETTVVMVPDSQASCATGGCLELPEPSDISLDSCVRGRVTDKDGNPRPNETVFIVPGETVQTNASGEFCGRAPGAQEVDVFAVGHVSVRVHTPADGSCAAGTCAVANLEASLPGEGDQVGSVVAFSNNTILLSDLIGPEFQSFRLAGNFQVLTIRQPGTTVTREQMGNCEILTSDLNITVDPDEPFVSPFTGSALDPGNPGTAGNGEVSVQLQSGDPFATDPPNPLAAGSFSPVEDDLLALGFAPGDAITFEWPGGADVGPFVGPNPGSRRDRAESAESPR